MYICLCNGLKESQVDGARQEGCASVRDLFIRHGCAPQCGRCLPYLKECMEGTCPEAQE